MMDMTIERLTEILEKAASANCDIISEFNDKGDADDWAARDIEMGHNDEYAQGIQDTILTILSGISNNQQSAQMVDNLIVELEYPD
jgi:hypothetical protein